MQQTAEVRYVRATVAYDGTDYLGFQWQSRGRTVQSVLEQALVQVTGGAWPGAGGSRVIGAGRTDAGVHARGQVIGFRLPWRHPLEDLQRALNAVLPQDVAVLTLSAAELHWHPRFSARRRHYRYSVLYAPVRSPLDRRYVYHVAAPLDLAALRRGAAMLLGEHDFASFGRPMQRGYGGTSPDRREGVSGAGTIRHLYVAEWRQDGSRFELDVVGNAFLRGMVRNIAGTLLQVGMGAWPVERVTEILNARDRALSAPPTPACGLCLMKVEYEE